MSAYDRWLEQPYQDRYDDEDRYEHWYENSVEEVKQEIIDYIKDDEFNIDVHNFLDTYLDNIMNEWYYEVNKRDSKLECIVDKYITKYEK